MDKAGAMQRVTAAAAEAAPGRGANYAYIIAPSEQVWVSARRIVRLAVVFTAALLQGCIYVPRTTTVYDEECKTHTRHMTLQPEQIGHFGSCHGRDCVYVLVALGAVAAASAVVSGSIAVAGNVVYWAEKQGRCSFKG